MKLTALQALIAAVEEGSLRAAARRVSVSQPALTKIVRELEQDVAAPLLVRSTTGVVPTAQGQVLYERARVALRELSGAMEEIAQLGGHMVGELRIGAVPLAVMLLIPETLRTFSREFRQVHLHIREELYIEQLMNLRRSDVDVAIGPIPENLPQGEFHIEALMPVSMVVVVRRGSPLAGARSLEELRSARWVYTGLAGVTGYARRLFEHHGMQPPEVGATVNSTLGLLSLIGSGDFVGLMPRPLALHPAAAAFLEMPPIREGTLELSVSAITKADAVLKPAVRHFLAHLHRAAHQMQRAGRG
ncbi:LysR family transcriptional regulator [Sphaerotilus hippei]|uniref:LysR family transcriptional regulator n=1 Tax=Sphaerotilus hippei TaxID=744406 RepID=A0A318H3Z3_9BURK|nr:LysR substrate-binding domain-containing protein [Sphaerotilus hippei]PXW97634.1 LysR family transcriptional regulator [Sphaerotilus hippei]